MPGRKLLMIMNFGKFGDALHQNVRIVIGDRGIQWRLSNDPPNPTLPDSGFGLDKFELVEIPVNDSVAVFAFIDPNAIPGGDEDVDLRTLELG